MLDNSNRRVAATVVEEKQKKAAKKGTSSKTKKAAEGIDSNQRTAPRGNDMPSDSNPDAIVGQPCPLCGKGHIIKGKTAYGCSEWRNGCGWRKAF
jgi:DNA topoisomerase-3